jgi:CHAT domain-containing protein/Tfp pilus assembly protein PilF
VLGACTREVPSEEVYQEAVSDLRRGNLVSAEAAVQKGAGPWRDVPQSPWHWKYKLLDAEIRIQQGRSKDALALLETELPNSPDLGTVGARWKIVRARALLRQGRAGEARPFLDAAEAIAATANQQSLIPEIEMHRGYMFDVLRQPSEAESAYRAAIKDAQKLQDTYWETVGLNNLGVLRIRQLRYDEAIPLFVRAQEGFEKMGARLFASIALNNVGLCAGYLGDFDRASAAHSKAIEVQEREGAKLYLQLSLGQAGNLYARQNDFAKAIPYYQRALALALETGGVPDAARWSGNLAVAFTELKEWGEAESFNEQARQLKERVNDTESRSSTALNAANIARGRGDVALAEHLYGEVLSGAKKDASLLWEAHGGLAQLYRDDGDKKKAYEHFDAAITTIEASRAELSLPDYRITFLSRLMNFYQQYVDALVEQNAVDRALEVAESSRARVLAERLGRPGQPQRSPSVETYAQVSRRSGTTFLAYWLAPSRSFLWVITPKTRKLFVLPPKSEVETLVRSYQTVVDSSRDPLEAVPPAASRLYDILLSPARELVPAGSSVVIVPDGELHNLNFETLPVPGEKPHYWIEDATVAVAPSLAVNPAPSERASLKSLLLIGNPTAASPEYASLPYAAAEVRNVEHRLAKLEQSVYEGQRAQPPVYRTSDPSKYSIIHFAAHAFANRESPLESAIVLSSSGDSFKLYARDVMNTPLRAELVTVSACRGAGARVYSGEGLVGFTWAFLQAGAKNVIAGLWDVSDSSTAQLMDQLYAGIDAGKSPATALRDAKLSLIHSQNNYRKPYYWGAFQVFVGGDRR